MMKRPWRWLNAVLLLATCSAFAAEAPKPDAGKLAAQVGSPDLALKREAIYQLGKAGAQARGDLSARQSWR